jgi:hypothetical protein
MRLRSHLRRLCVYGYVVMPEHVHLLLSEPQRGTLAEALKSLKQGVCCLPAAIFYCGFDSGGFLSSFFSPGWS